MEAEPTAAPAPAVSAEAPRPTPEMIAAAWRVFRGDRPGPLLGPGPGFAEAIAAAMALDPRVAELEAEVGRLQSTLAMPTHMLVPRVLPSGALKAAERHCDWRQFQHAWGAILNWIEADAAQRGRTTEREGKDG